MSPSVSVRLLLTQSDERLVDYARAGHERAFEALVERYRRQLLRYCRRLLLSEERAEDALQQALLQAWVALRGGAEVHDVRPWLYRIVHNAAVNVLRVSGYDYCTLSESLSGADAPQADLDRRIAVREALAGLAALPEMQREALLRTAVEGRSHQQVASDLGVSEPALRGLVYRARTSLRAAAGAFVPPPLLSWALDAGTRGAPVMERVAGLGVGSGSAGVIGLIVKGSAVAVTAGALAGGIVAEHSHKHRAHPAVARSSAGTDGLEKSASAAMGVGTSVRPVAFTRLSPTRHGDKTITDRRSTHRHLRFAKRPAPPVQQPAQAPALTWSHHHHEDGGHQQDDDGGPPAFGPSDGDGRDSGGSGLSGSISGDGERHDARNGGSLDEGSGGSGGKDGSGDTSDQFGGGETSSSKDGGGDSSGGSGDSRQSEATSAQSSTTTPTSGSGGREDQAGSREGSSSG